jgi:hypothetical protein
MTASAPTVLYPKQTAAMVRKLLRLAFPACRFSVTTGRGAGVSSVRISWTDGPTVQRVNEIVGQFEAGHFDGMQDMYVRTNDRVLVINGQQYEAGCRYIFTDRKISAELAAKCIAQVVAYWGGVEQVPTPIDGSFGFRLQPEDLMFEPVRPDLSSTSHSWNAEIHRVAEDRTERVRI